MAGQSEPGRSAGIELEKNIRSIFQDSRGNYWFGTHDAGVYRYDGKVLSHFTEKDGLSSDQVRAIQDHSGNLWFGTGGFAGLLPLDGQSFKTYVGPGGLRPAGKPKKKWETRA